MELELSLTELNQLYYAMTRYEQIAEAEYKQYPSEFFQKQLDTAKVLTQRMQDALYAEAKKIDEAIDYIREKRNEYINQ
jgi:hypothetical protein